jgi:HK97 family phage major capsid protein
MALYTPAAVGLLPEEIDALIVQPVTRLSVAMQVATVVQTGAHDLRVPQVIADPTASWVAEGAEITASDADLDEIIITPKKVAGLSIISRELADDSSPEAQSVVGDGLARNISLRVDQAFFGNTTTNGPSGLLSLAGIQVVDTGAAIANTDVFADALSKAEDVGATITAFCANPATVLALAKVKKQTGSNEPLLGSDPTQPTQRVVLGVPLFSTPAIAAGTIWAIARDRVLIAVRQDATLDVDASAYFSSDRIGIRSTMRVGFGFPHEQAVVRLYDAA